ncbi:5-guanidino-2-oxopentanoate decarboxylase [Vibrio sp. TH_r3]|uniref:5-guanidino-2-oxopentanoate decarboxylase n=1 Tax=Vibrio sp. TH_r3 TaxID=3082084 RepID=UPI002953AD23|nr:5-guanidino-2-oxopentanoate decarboxylase [Vibrio sp. TH_r3]MDV7103595.1 5-guanidino-2-oxopentanoate decarboxylase [Vibrio sp. TH_r3]
MAQKYVTLGARLPALLVERGIDSVFGIPGVHTVEMYRGLPQSGLRHITPRHEQGAGFMADGYARSSGKPAACFIISGPGMTNILTAMGQAYADSIPMLVISSVNAHGKMGSGEGWLHELPNQSELVSGVAAFSRTVHHPAELEKALDDAFAIFQCGRPRPVHIEIPLDVLLEKVADLPLATKPLLMPSAPAKAPLNKAIELLHQASSPVILAGGGAKQSNLRLLAEKLDAPVVMTTNARGLMPIKHPLAVPISPSYPQTRELVRNADVVLALGTEMGPTDYDWCDDGGFKITGTLIRVDIDPTQLNRNLTSDVGITADAAETVMSLIETLSERKPNNGQHRAAQARGDRDAFPASAQGDLRLLEIVREHFPNSPVVGDSTQITYSAIMGYEASRPGGYFCSATGFGTLGYGLPAAIGASIASEEHVIAITGDGGLQFCLGELASAMESKAKVVMLLHDNNGYGEIKDYMQDKDIPLSGVDIYTPDLAQVAKACGWVVYQPNAENMTDTLLKAKSIDGPSLIYISEETRLSF